MTTEASARRPARRATGSTPRWPHPARLYDYWLGGKDNFAGRPRVRRRDGGTPSRRSAPPPWTTARFLQRAVRLPGPRGRHPAVPRHRHRHPDRRQHPRGRPGASPRTSRIVYVDNDPIVLAHARALLTSTAAGRHRLHRRRPARPGADPRAPGAAPHHRPSRPVALMLVAVLHFVPDERRPVRAGAAPARRAAGRQLAWPPRTPPTSTFRRRSPRRLGRRPGAAAHTG